MAGHSKWANIKHRKAKEDARKGKVFTKLIREITVAARLGSGDVTSNPRLRAAVLAALAANMTRDTIDRAVKRGAGGLEGNDVEEITYEGYAAGGVAIIVECMTNNRNRTVAEIRHAFTKCGGNLGTDGSVAYLFTKKGVITFYKGVDEEKLLEAALELGIDDMVNHEDGSIDVITSFEAFAEVKHALEEMDMLPDNAEINMIASTNTTLDKETAEKVLRLIDMLEDLDDVQNVHTNAVIPDEVIAELNE